MLPLFYHTWQQVNKKVSIQWMQLESYLYAMTYMTILQLHVYEKSFRSIWTLDLFVSHDKFSLGLSLIVITSVMQN